MISKPQRGWGDHWKRLPLTCPPTLAWPRPLTCPDQNSSREMKVCNARLLASLRGLRPQGKSTPSFPQ